MAKQSTPSPAKSKTYQAVSLRFCFLSLQGERKERDRPEERKKPTRNQVDFLWPWTPACAGVTPVRVVRMTLDCGGW